MPFLETVFGKLLLTFGTAMVPVLDGGDVIELKDFMGFAEKVHNRY